jgi:hypothetical protein
MIATGEPEFSAQAHFFRELKCGPLFGSLLLASVLQDGRGSTGVSAFPASRGYHSLTRQEITDGFDEAVRGEDR